MESVADRIRYFRLRAEELRAAMEGMQTSEAKATFARMAENYELAADRLEAREHRAEDEKPSSA